MGLSDKMSNVAGQVQESVKNTASALLLFVFKALSALAVGTTISLIAQEIIGYQTLSFIFVLLVVSGALFKAMSKWSWGKVLLFDLFLVLVSLLMRMYILIAP
jgi:hypothetical protein